MCQNVFVHDHIQISEHVWQNNCLKKQCQTRNFIEDMDFVGKTKRHKRNALAQEPTCKYTNVGTGWRSTCTTQNLKCTISRLKMCSFDHNLQPHMCYLHANVVIVVLYAHVYIHAQANQKANVQGWHLAIHANMCTYVVCVRIKINKDRKSVV